MKTLLIVLFISTQSFASLDVLVGGNLRSYPGIGGGSYLKLGHNVGLVGDISSSSPWYSMLRIQGELNTSSVVYHHDGQVLLYPLGFFAIGAGRKEMTSNYDEFSFYNCELVECKGKLNKDYSLAKIAISFSNIILSHEYRISRISYDRDEQSNKGQAEYEYTLSTTSDTEISHKRTYFVGLKFTPYIIGAYANYIDFQESNKFFSEHYLILRHKIENFDYIIGAGNLYSSDQKPSPTAMIQINYRFISNQALF